MSVGLGVSTFVVVTGAEFGLNMFWRASTPRRLGGNERYRWILVGPLQAVDR